MGYEVKMMWADSDEPRAYRVRAANPLAAIILAAKAAERYDGLDADNATWVEVLVDSEVPAE